MKRTPGPWAISKLATPDYAPEFGIYAEGSERDLARVIGDNSKANAALIAAAPDLLLALVEIARVAPSHIGHIALTAIAKATGE